MKADFTIHGGWGNHIEWVDSKEFATGNIGSRLFRVWGHLPCRPQVGDTLMDEFQRSYIKFEFVEVRLMTDPPDMFFGKVKAIEQEMKSREEAG